MGKFDKKKPKHEYDASRSFDRPKTFDRDSERPSKKFGGPNRFEKRDFRQTDSEGPRKFGRRDSGGPKRFNDRGPKRFGRRDSDTSRGREESRSGVMQFPATCAKCGQACNLPFRPTNNKPVYCSNCFREKEDEPRDSRGFRGSDNSRDLEQINRKLDKIMRALEIN